MECRGFVKKGRKYEVEIEEKAFLYKNQMDFIDKTGFEGVFCVEKKRNFFRY